MPVSTSTSIPVASFTTANTSLTAGSFSAIVFNYDTTGHGHVNWTVTSITGGDGHFVVNAEPNSAVAAGTYGTTYAQAEGLYVDILDNSGADAAAVDGGIPIAQTYAPYVVAATSPLTYTTDAGTHNLVLKENGANFELRDNGNLVFTQLIALTTSIVIKGDGDPAGVDNSLTLDYSGGVFNTLPVLFDGGNGSGSHKVTVTGDCADVVDLRRCRGRRRRLRGQRQYHEQDHLHPRPGNHRLGHDGARHAQRRSEQHHRRAREYHVHRPERTRPRLSTTAWRVSPSAIPRPPS